jgi:hypothetical protein
MSYGCHNRKPLRSHQTVQAGWRYVMGDEGLATRVPVLKRAEVPMTKDCQHTLGEPKDPGCAGCRWRAQV